MPIRGTTQLVGLLGWPVAHSLSPLMHAAAFEALGLDWAYVPLPVRPEAVGDAVRGLRALGFRGANVTIPHKQAVIPFLDRLAETASAIGAVNTIEFSEDGHMIGHNTDAEGAYEAIHLGAGFNPAGQRVAILGAGGAARALAFGALFHGATSLAILNRQIEMDAAHALARDLQATARASQRPAEVVAFAFENDNARAAVTLADLVTQATPLGMHEGDPMPIPPEWVREGVTVFDAVYSAARDKSPFLEACAHRRGCATVGGLGMLLFQGVAAFRIWTGKEPDVALMERALRGALSKKS